MYGSEMHLSVPRPSKFCCNKIFASSAVVHLCWLLEQGPALLQTLLEAKNVCRCAGSADKRALHRPPQQFAEEDNGHPGRVAVFHSQ